MESFSEKKNYQKPAMIVFPFESRNSLLLDSKKGVDVIIIRKS